MYGVGFAKSRRWQRCLVIGHSTWDRGAKSGAKDGGGKHDQSDRAHRLGTSWMVGGDSLELPTSWV